ncbi:MAG: hypothetical protein PVTTEEND_000518, partial [Candidatus Fervidibacter sp.]
MGIFGWMFARFFFPNVLFEPPPAFEAGYPHEYPVGSVDGRWKERYNVWIVHEPYGFFVLDGTCTHLGCKPPRVEVGEQFKCPCRGSGFRKDGLNFEGPAPRPLWGALFGPRPILLRALRPGDWAFLGLGLGVTVAMMAIA